LWDGPCALALCESYGAGLTVNLMLNFTPLIVTDMVTAVADVTGRVLMLKSPKVDPAEIEQVASGTATLEFELAIVAVTPPVGAAEASVMIPMAL